MKSVARRCDAEMAAFIVVQYGSKDTRRIKMREAIPIDRPIVSNKRYSMHVADDAMVLYSQIHL